jgi:hypothetical protein
VTHRRLAATLVLAALSLVPAAPAAADQFVIGVLGDSYAAGEASPAVPGLYNDHGDKGINPFTEIGQQCIDPDNVLRNRCHDETWWQNIAGVAEPQADDAGWEHDTQRCHRSSIATGPEAARRLAAAIKTTYPSVEVVLFDLACSGASIKNLTTTSYEGIELQGDTPKLPAQVGALQDVLNGRRVDAIVVDIGGNDMQFASWVAACAFLPVSCVGNTLITQPFRAVVPPANAAPSPQDAVESDAKGTIDQRYEHLALRLRSPDHPGGNLPGASDTSLAQVPGQVYLTAVPQPMQDENGNVCDGTQTTDQFYKEIKGAEGPFLRDTVVADITASMARAATRHDWQLVSEITSAANTHGICSSSSFFRTNIGGLHRQGNDLFPEEEFINFWLPDSLQLPRLSAGIAHPTDQAYGTYGQLVANRLDDQVEFRFRPPGISLLSATASPPGFQVQLVDATSTDTGFWQLEVNGQLINSDAVGGDFTHVGPLQRWTRSGAGEFVVRGRECFKKTAYCGPFSAALTVANTVPGAPQNLHRNLPNPSTLRDKSIAVDWDAGVNTTPSTTYEVAYKQTFDACQFRLSGECVGGVPLATGEQTAATGTTRSFRLGSAAQPLQAGDQWSFRVRACTDAGCGAYSPSVNLPVTEPVIKATVVGVPTLRVPDGALHAGKPATVELAWTAPRRWTDLRDVDVVLDSRRPRGRAHKRRVGTIRFVEARRDLEVRGAHGAARSGAPDSDVARTLKVPGFTVDLHASGLLRYGPDARQVTLRLALIPGRALRGRVLTLSVGGRDDRGRRQAPSLAAALRVR